MAIAWAQHAAAAVALHAGEPAAAAERALASAAAAEEVGRRDRGRAVADARRTGARGGRRAGPRGGRDRARGGDVRGLRRRSRTATPPSRSCAASAGACTGARRPGAAGAEGLAALTERELQVAELVVDRKTNPEIAAELFLSHKTVETHLRNIFRKLGVSSRVELARAVERARRGR